MWSSESCISKLNIKTDEVVQLPKTTLRTIHCFAVNFGLIALCSHDVVKLYHEKSEQVIYQQIIQQQPNNLLLTTLNDRYFLLVMSNDGKFVF